MYRRILPALFQPAETTLLHKLVVVLGVFSIFILSSTHAALAQAGACSETVFVSPISLFGGDAAGLAVDQQGNLFVAENVHPSISGGPKVSKVSPLGAKTTLVPQGTLGDVTALVVDDQGNLFVADGNGIGAGQPGAGNAVWKVDPQGHITKFISGVNNPTGLAFDYDAHNLYVASFGDSAVYKFSPTGVALGPAVTGLPDAPYGITFDLDNNLYIAGFGNPANGTKVFKVTPQGQLSIFFDGSPLTSPASLVFDRQENLYVSYYNGLKIVRIAPDGSSTEFPGGCVGDDAANGLVFADEVFLYTGVNGGRTTIDPAVVKLQGIVPPASDCHGQLVSIYAHRYGGLSKAATALGFANVKALQDSIQSLCGN
jgi:sugar lactone lactonase YvrE